VQRRAGPIQGHLNVRRGAQPGHVFARLVGQEANVIEPRFANALVQHRPEDAITNDQEQYVLPIAQ